MKKLYSLKWFVLLMVALSTIGCEFGSDVIWDVGPVDMYIRVYNQEGENLLDEDVEGNILENDIKITYNDVEYRLGEDVEETRAYLPEFMGLQLYTQNALGEKDCRLYFGQFEGADDYTLTATLDLGDGVEREVGFIHEFEWKKGEPVGETTYTLDGKKLDDNYIVIVL
ncbi:MAG: hypothetical protein SNG49_00810 [Rikenellaceae bacterium]